MVEIIDIRYTTETDRKYRNINLIRCFDASIKTGNYIYHLKNLLKRDDVIKITIEKYEVDS